MSITAVNYEDNGRTVHFALESLVAHFADELRYALFAVNSDGHRLVMMAEYAGECSVWRVIR